MTLLASISGGAPEALHRPTRSPVQHPGPGEVLVQVLATGVNAAEIKSGARGEATKGHPETHGSAELIPFPRNQGADLCGRVIRHGAGVTEPRIGARVVCRADPAGQQAGGLSAAFRSAGSADDAAFAEFCVVPANRLCDVSASVLADMDVDAMLCAYGTAHNLLSRAEIRRGEKLLVVGASGNVGMAAVRLARLRGARVTCQCSAESAGVVLTAGARATLARCRSPEAKSFDVVVDVAAGPDRERRLGVLRPRGRYAVSGAFTGQMVEGDLRSVYLNDLSLFGCAHQLRDVFSGLVTIVRIGDPRPSPSETGALRGIATAWASQAARPRPNWTALTPNERSDNG